MSGGVLVLVVGPSGAGKDSLIAGAREKLGADDRFVFPRRIVTRASTVHEDHDTLTEHEFASQLASGTFALHWQAHGLSYGLRRDVGEQLAMGRIAVCNVSRAVVPSARKIFGKTAAIYIDARPDLRAARIAARGRDAPTGSRIGGAKAEATPQTCEFVIDNSGALQAAVDAFTNALLAIERGRTHA